MVALQPLVSEFTIVGRLEDYVVNSKAHIKYLQLSTEAEEYLIKVAKEQNNVNLLSQHLKLGCWLKVTGMQKYELHKDRVKYTAYKIELLGEPISEKLAARNKISPTNPKAKILFCQDSTCCQKGGRAAYELLKTELRSHGIADQVEIQPTGCMKQCKTAPNLIIMPGRIRYNRVQPQQVSQLMALLNKRQGG